MLEIVRIVDDKLKNLGVNVGNGDGARMARSFTPRRITFQYPL
jgi:hypothetical protein